MGIFDRLRGKREDAAAEVSSAEAAAAVSASSLDLTEVAPAPAGPSSRQQQFTKQFGVAPSEELYNPYEGGFARSPWGLWHGCARQTLRLQGHEMP